MPGVSSAVLMLLRKRGITGFASSGPFSGGGGGGGGAGASPPVITSLGYTPAPPNHPAPTSLSRAASADHVAQVATKQNELLQGRLNITATVTLTANVDSTTITDSRISPTNAVILVPSTASAATEAGAGSVYVSSQTTGSAVIAHANNAGADRTYRIVILG